MILFPLIKFNNYYNRIVKKFDDLQSYSDLCLKYYPDVQFNKGDGIDATWTLTSWDYAEPDYLVVANTNGDVDSRWFIIECKWNRQGQYLLTLRRDIVADNLDKVLSNRMFIEKGLVDASNPLIYNSENITVNQIKTKQIPIADRSGVSWLVGYIPRNLGATTVQIYDYGLAADYEEASFADFFENNIHYVPLENNTYNIYDNIKMNFSIYKGYNRWGAQFEIDLANNTYSASGAADFGTHHWEYRDITYTELAPLLLRLSISARTSIQNAIINDHSDDQLLSNNIIRASDYNGKTLKIGSNYYRIHIAESYGTITRGGHSSDPISSNSYYYNTVKSDVLLHNDYVTLNVDGPDPFDSYTVKVKRYKFEFIEMQPTSATINIPAAADRRHCLDAPYDIFIIPYKNINKTPLETLQTQISIIESDTTGFIVNKDIGIKAGNAIAQSLTGQDEMYDLQILPYTPSYILNRCDTSDDIYIRYDMRKFASNEVTYIKDRNNQQPVSLLFWLDKSNFELEEPTTVFDQFNVTDKKISKTCDLFRLVSPNQNGIFEFSPASCDNITSFKITCSYKPYTPYIKVAPQFSGLYGGNFQDSRGLICGGEFSLPAVNSSWRTYELQNKNYELTFQRQIENMETNNAIQNARARTDMAILATQTAMNLTKSITKPGRLGVAFGAEAIKSGANFASQINQYRSNLALQNEAIDYTQDLFGYQLDNIKAIPQSLSKVSTLNNDNTIWPVLEYYTCSDAEREAVKNKIMYNGMTLMVIGRIRDYIGYSLPDWYTSPYIYFKGQLINSDITGDFHELNALAGELSKGLYFPQNIEIQEE